MKLELGRKERNLCICFPLEERGKEGHQVIFLLFIVIEWVQLQTKQDAERTENDLFR